MQFNRAFVAVQTPRSANKEELSLYGITLLTLITQTRVHAFLPLPRPLRNPSFSADHADPRASVFPFTQAYAETLFFLEISAKYPKTNFLFTVNG